MRKLMIVLSVSAVATMGSAACATKGFVRNQVGQVSSKVDSLGQALEQTQERQRESEQKLGQQITAVDQKAGAAQSAADQAGTTATAAGTSASAANDAAKTAMAKAEEVQKTTSRIVYEVVLSEDQGNFKFGTADLPDAAKAAIDQLIGRIMSDPKGAYFEIEGHTDNVGDAGYNERLGLQRAEVVKRYLYEQHHIPLHKMNVISYGEAKPAVDNKTAQGRAQNRRVVIRVIA